MSEHLVELRTAWQRHVAPDTSLLDGVVGRHREQHRRYHGVTHVAWVVRHVDELAAEEQPPDVDAVVAAAFYHDAVYEPTHPANERASARLAAGDLRSLGWADERVDHVVEMIESTADHRDPADLDTAVLFDADLAVLGSDPAAYRDYAAGVRTEYRHVSDADWHTGRAAVLRSFLDRPSIYATRSGRERWEDRARANISAELASLAG